MLIVSGGQTGVDRAGLDAASALGLPCGGYVPRGRFAEDGRLPERYPMTECKSKDYAVRTELNVIHSDATLILHHGAMVGGTQLTFELCREHHQPVHTIDLAELSPIRARQEILGFIRREKPKVLNVAGPRESGCPGIYAASLRVLKEALKNTL